MKKIFLVFVLFLSVWATSACATSPRNPAQPPPPGMEEFPPSREATFGEVENDVKMRPTSEGEMRTAEIGQIIYPGGGARSGDDSRARLDLLPEKTILRIGPNSSFTLEELSSDPHSPSTRLKLLFGEVWIILSGGELELETSYGVASVRGSMMSVSFDPDGAGMTVTCLEGHCALENDVKRVEIDEGFASEIAKKGQPPSEIRPLSEEEVEDWKESTPEIEPWLQGTPMPTQEPPPPPPEGQGGGGSSSYSLTNSCEEGNWKITFAGPGGFSISLAPGESASGTLPPGDFTVTDTLEGARSHGPDLLPAGGHLKIVSCPD